MFNKDSEDICPFLGKQCIKHRCALYIQLQGTNPNNGQPINEWGCSLAWLPILSIETTQQMRQAGAAIESFRNEMVSQNEQLLDSYSETQRLEERNKGNGISK